MKKFICTIIALVASATSAMAFPSWIGVYGSTVRHDDAYNPGAFTILMNQDYYGLKAEVGVQVNGGTWQTYAMSYAGRVDNNSKWTFTPSAAFPAGATVQYYFHGFDGSGHIYDSRNGANYSFQVPAVGALSFRAPRTILNGGGNEDAAVRGTSAYVSHVTSSSFNVAVCSLVSTADARVIVLTTNMVNDGSIAAGDYTVVAAAAIGSGVQVFRSTDGGATFRPEQVVNVTTDGSAVVEVEIKALGANHFAMVCRSGFIGSSIWFLRSFDGGMRWGAPALVDSTFYAGDVHVGGTASGYVMAYVAMPGQRAADLRAAVSADGATWSRTNLVTVLGGGGPGAVSLVASSRTLIMLDNPYGQQFWDYSNGAWRAVGSVSQNASGSSVAELFDGRLALVSASSSGASLRVSGNGAASWSAPSQISASSEIRVVDLLPVPGGLDIVWHRTSADWSHSTWLQNSARPALQWVGHTDPWPLNGDLDAGDDLWINTETWPKGSAAGAFVAYSIDGTNWLGASMSLAGENGNNDWWHVNLGKFMNGVTIRYAVAAVDEFGAQRWDTNGGQNYSTRVNTNPNMTAPWFGKMDPYRGDSEKIHVNGRTKDASLRFGSFGPGEQVTVSARPVENGNDNLVQFSVEMTSLLVYTTNPNDWSQAVGVPGVFRTGGISNKPIFDSFSYDLGTFAPGTTVWFWIGANNSKGSGYAQSYGELYSFTVQ